MLYDTGEMLLIDDMHRLNATTLIRRIHCSSFHGLVEWRYL